MKKSSGLPSVSWCRYWAPRILGANTRRIWSLLTFRIRPSSMTVAACTMPRKGGRITAISDNRVENRLGVAHVARSRVHPDAGALECSDRRLCSGCAKAAAADHVPDCAHPLTPATAQS